MAFPTSGYEPQTADVLISWDVAGGAMPDSVTIRFQLAYAKSPGSPGLSEACFEQAMQDAVAAFEAAAAVEALAVHPAVWKYNGTA